MGQPVESVRLERKPIKRPPPPNALSPAEKARIREALNSERFADQAIPQAHTAMLEEGQHLASVSTMYRIMREHGEVHERRDQSSPARGASRTAPVLCVTQPNTAWSWDITKMRGHGHSRGQGLFYCLYVVLESGPSRGHIFSRYVVGSPRPSGVG